MSKSLSTKSRPALLIFAACVYLAFSVIALGSVDDRQGWGGDFALYIMHARNIVEGREYASTEWLYNPEQWTMSPKAYPPGLPVLLAPAYALYGIDLSAFKAVITLCFLGSVLLIVAWVYRHYDIRIALASALLFALNPYVWNFRVHVMAEFPFILLSFAALVALDIRHDYLKGWTGVAASAVVGGIAYAAFATRPQGIVLPIAIILVGMARWRDMWKSVVAFTLAFCALWLLSPVAPVTLRSYARPDAVESSPSLEAVIASGPRVSLSQRLRNIPESAVRYVTGYSWEIFPRILAVRVALVVASLIAVIAGIYARHFMGIKRRVARATGRVGPWVIGAIARMGAGEVYAAGIIAIATAVYFDNRYMMPAFPFVITYALLGVREIAKKARIAEGTAVGVAVLIVLMAYGVRHVDASYAAVRGDRSLGVQDVQSQDMFAAIRERIPKGEIVAFAKPRTLALFTGQRATIWDPVEGVARVPEVVRARAFMEDFINRNVKYMVVSERSDLPGFCPPSLGRLRAAGTFELLYENDSFEIFRFDADRAEAILAEPEFEL